MERSERGGRLLVMDGKWGARRAMEKKESRVSSRSRKYK